MARPTAPDNAHPERRHLNRDDFIKYPEGVTNLGEAIQYRLDHAELTRKIGKNQVLALNVLMSSDGDALRILADEDKLNDWAESSIRWAIETFGEAVSLVGLIVEFGGFLFLSECHLINNKCLFSESVKADS